MYCLIWMKLNFFILSCKILVKWYCKVYTMCSIVKYRKCMAYCKNAVFFLSLYLFIIFVLFFFISDREPKTRNLLFGNDRHSDKIRSEKTDCDSGKDRETRCGSGILHSPPRSIRKEIPGVHQQVHRMMAAKFVFSFSQCIQKKMMILCPPDTVQQVMVSESRH